MNVKIKIPVLEKMGRKDMATMNYDVDHNVSLMTKVSQSQWDKFLPESTYWNDFDNWYSWIQ